MFSTVVKIEGKSIRDWESFFREFDRVFGFPEWFKPENGSMDGWIDFMSSLNDPDDNLTKIHCEKGKVLTIQVESAADFKMRCPEQFNALVECSAFVNWRLIDLGNDPVIALSYYIY